MNRQYRVNNAVIGVLMSFYACVAFTGDAEREATDIYTTEQQAATAASNYYNPLSIYEDREYIGAIFRHQQLGYFRYTAQAGRRFSDAVTLKLVVPAGYDWVALWHTHGKADEKNRYFSPQDTQIAKRFKVPFYLANADGTLKVFTPRSKTLSASRARKMGLGFQSGIALGERVADSRGKPIEIATTLSQWSQLNRNVQVAGGEGALNRMRDKDA